MTGVTDPQAPLVAFLLGTLPEAEHEDVEQRLFGDDRLQGELEVTTDDLIHAYLAGTLPPAARTAFEGHFLASPDHRERLTFLSALVEATGRVAAPGREARRRPWALAAAAVLATMAALLAFLALGRAGGPRQAVTSPRPTVTTPSLPLPEATRSPIGPTPPGEQDAGEPVRLVQLAKSPRRDPAEVLLTPATRTVRLEVPVALQAPSYDVALKDGRGREAWRAEGLVPSAFDRPLVLSVPAEVFESGDYVLSIEGEVLRGETDAPPLEHRLRVVRRGP